MCGMRVRIASNPCRRRLRPLPRPATRSSDLGWTEHLVRPGGDCNISLAAVLQVREFGGEAGLRPRRLGERALSLPFTPAKLLS